MDVRKHVWPLLCTLSLFPSLTLSQTSIRAFTKPSADVTLSFIQPGRVVDLPLKEGQTVKKGDLVAKQDDAMEQVKLAQATSQAEDTTQVKASQASLEQKKVDLKKLEIAAQQNAATDLEVEHARLNVTIAELSLELAKFKQNLTKYDQQTAQIHVDRTQLHSPVNGRVEEVYVESGESVNALDKVIRIVQIDPLWIDASIQTPLASQLKPGDKINIQFSNPNTLQTGHVVYVAAVADSASQTLRVRIETSNKTGRPAGEQVEINLNSLQQP